MNELREKLKDYIENRACDWYSLNEKTIDSELNEILLGHKKITINVAYIILLEHGRQCINITYNCSSFINK